jgi:hypothetical protein
MEQILANCQFPLPQITNDINKKLKAFDPADGLSH